MDMEWSTVVELEHPWYRGVKLYTISSGAEHNSESQQRYLDCLDMENFIPETYEEEQCKHHRGSECYIRVVRGVDNNKYAKPTNENSDMFLFLPLVWSCCMCVCCMYVCVLFVALLVFCFFPSTFFLFFSCLKSLSFLLLLLLLAPCIFLLLLPFLLVQFYLINNHKAVHTMTILVLLIHQRCMVVRD